MKPHRGRRLLSGLGIALGLSVTRPALAQPRVVASDDAMFSVDLGAATVCFVAPARLRVDEDCEGIDLADFPVAGVDAPMARLAYGVVRGAGAGASRPILGIVSMLRAPSSAPRAPDEAAASQIGAEAGESVARSLPPGARLLPPSSRLAWGRNVPVVRTSLEVVGLPPGEGELDAHREIVTAIGGRYVYVTVWSGAVANAAALARLADAAAATTDLKPEGRPQAALNPWPGRLLFAFGALGLVLLRVRQSKRKAPRPSSPAA